MDWKPIFGQEGISQKHLANNKITKGDIFLFFGLFREVVMDNKKINYKKGSLPKHIIWGWLQVKDILTNHEDISALHWASYHPHYNRFKYKDNALYISSPKLVLQNLILPKDIDGAGVFEKVKKSLVLTSNHKNTSCWELPSFFFPKDITKALTYHQDISKWKLSGDKVFLNTVGRGQEFVLDFNYYPEAFDWISNLFN